MNPTYIKSIIYKKKYYALSFKLNFIFKLDLFKYDKTKIQILSSQLKDNGERIFDVIAFNKFLINKVKYSFLRGDRIIHHYMKNNKAYKGISYKNGKLCMISYWRDGIDHKLDGPSLIKYYENGQVEYMRYHLFGMRHRLDGPGETGYYENGNIKYEIYYKNSTLHRLDGPAIINYNQDGKVAYKAYFRKGSKI